MNDFSLSTPQEIVSSLCARIKKQRLEKNLTQEELARRAGVSKGTINNLETKGQCTFETFIRAVSALDLTAELNELFISRTKSIAEMEKESLLQRQRASHPRSKLS